VTDNQNLDSSAALRFNRPTHVVVRLRRLRKMPVIELSARRLGNVEEIYLDPVGGRLGSLEVRGGILSSGERIAGTRIRRVGANAVMLAGKELSPALPEDDDWVESEDVLGMEVIDDGGDRMGFIQDVYVNRDTLAIEAYELETPWWEHQFRGPRLIMPGQIHSSSNDLMIALSRKRAAIEVPTATVAPERRFQVGWEERTVRVPFVPPQRPFEEEVPAKSA
jgi:uncharacterized protein YrrD